MENEKKARGAGFAQPPVERDSNKFHNDHSYFEAPQRFDGIILHQIGER